MNTGLVVMGTLFVCMLVVVAVGRWAIRNNDNIDGPAPGDLEDEYLDEPL